MSRPTAPSGSIVITPDGKTAYVSTGAVVTPINTATNTRGARRFRSAPAPNTSIGGGAQIVITPDGKTAYVSTEGRS